MSSEPPLSGLSSGRLELLQFDARPSSLPLTVFCTALAKACSSSRPLRQPDLLDVGIGGFRDRLVEVARRRRADDLSRDGGVRHLRRRLRDGVGDLEVLADVLEILLADEVPDGGDRRHDVGLVAAVRDHVVRTLLRPQVLAAHVPADVHQLDAVERAASPPGRHGGVGGLAADTCTRTETMPVPLGWPQEVWRLLPTWVKSTASTPLNTPSRTM